MHADRANQWANVRHRHRLLLEGAVQSIPWNTAYRAQQNGGAASPVKYSSKAKSSPNVDNIEFRRAKRRRRASGHLAYAVTPWHRNGASGIRQQRAPLTRRLYRACHRLNSFRDGLRAFYKPSLLEKVWLNGPLNPTNVVCYEMWSTMLLWSIVVHYGVVAHCGPLWCCGPLWSIMVLWSIVVHNGVVVHCGPLWCCGPLRCCGPLWSITVH